MNYYNEHDKHAAEWLRQLIREGVIPPGFVDERDIQLVRPADLAGYDQCHFFAGVGGWAHALFLARLPRDRKLWTGSCPCQPFSDAGLGLGAADARHLWPVWMELIRQCQPPVVLGEQVASKAALLWLDGVFLDLEGEGYACAAADLCAAGVGAPHIRQRLYWVAYSQNAGCERGQVAARQAGRLELESVGCSCGLAHAHGRQRDGLPAGEGRQSDRDATGRQQGDSELECGGAVGGLEHAPSDGREQRRTESGERCAGCGCGDDACGLGDTQHPRLEGHGGHEHDGGQPGRLNARAAGSVAAPSATLWDRFGIVHCTDGKTRRFEPGSFPLVDRISGRVGALRGYGNAINPVLVAEFVQAAEEARRFDLLGV